MISFEDYILIIQLRERNNELWNLWAIEKQIPYVFSQVESKLKKIIMKVEEEPFGGGIGTVEGLV